MSVADFQRALCDMTLNPTLAASVLRVGESALGEYQLTRVERARLLAVVRQRGMSVNCTLARANRFAPIANAFPLTCSLLKPQLRGLLDELWNAHKPASYQLAGEVEAFCEFLHSKVVNGDLDHPYIAEVFRYERAAWALINRLSHPSSSDHDQLEHCLTVRFEHDPHVLVRSLERDDIPPLDLPAGDYVVRLTLRGDVLDVQTVEQGSCASG